MSRLELPVLTLLHLIVGLYLFVSNIGILADESTVWLPQYYYIQTTTTDPRPELCNVADIAAGPDTDNWNLDYLSYDVLHASEYTQKRVAAPLSYPGNLSDDCPHQLNVKRQTHDTCGGDDLCIAALDWYTAQCVFGIAVGLALIAYAVLDTHITRLKKLEGMASTEYETFKYLMENGALYYFALAYVVVCLLSWNATERYIVHLDGMRAADIKPTGVAAAQAIGALFILAAVSRATLKACTARFDKLPTNKSFLSHFPVFTKYAYDYGGDAFLFVLNFAFIIALWTTPYDQLFESDTTSAKFQWDAGAGFRVEFADSSLETWQAMLVFQFLLLVVIPAYAYVRRENPLVSCGALVIMLAVLGGLQVAALRLMKTDVEEADISIMRGHAYHMLAVYTWVLGAQLIAVVGSLGVEVVVTSNQAEF